MNLDWKYFICLFFMVCSVFTNVIAQQEEYELDCQTESDAFTGKDRKAWHPDPARAVESYKHNFDIPTSHPDGIECLTLVGLEFEFDQSSETENVPNTPAGLVCWQGYFTHVLACDDVGHFDCPTSTIMWDNAGAGVLNSFFTTVSLDDSNLENGFKLEDILGTTIGFDFLPIVETNDPDCEACTISNNHYESQHKVTLTLIYEYNEPDDILNLPDEDEYCLDPSNPYEYDAPNDYENYVWEDAGGNVISSSDREEFLVPMPGDYTLIVTDQEGCIQEDVIEFKAIPQPPITFSTPNPLISCGTAVDTIRTSINGIQGNTNYTYEWQTPMGNTVNGSEIIPVDTGTYTLIVEDQAFSCDFIETFSVQSVPISPAQIDSLSINQLTLCDGASQTLEAFVPYDDLNPYTYRWAIGTDTTVASPVTTYSVTNPGKYFLIMENALGCPETLDSITVMTTQSLSAGDDNSELVCPSPQFDLDDYLNNQTSNTGTWIEITTNTVFTNSTPNVTAVQGIREYAYVVSNTSPCENDTAFIQITFPTILNCDDGDCNNGEEYWDEQSCNCLVRNVPDPNSCVDDGDCSNGDEIWNSASCICESINAPDPSSCVDDGDCANGIESWNTLTCNCDVSTEVDGCTDPTANNYNPLATCDNGTCDYNCPDPGTCDDNDCNNGEEVWDATICDCVTTNVPDPSSCVDDGDCTNGEEMWNATNCTCESINAPDPSTCVDDGDCANGIESWNVLTCNCDVSTEVDGCTDPTANNYNPQATCDDGTCDYNCPDPGTCDDNDCNNGEEVWDASICDCVTTNVPDPSSCVDDGDCTNGEEMWNATNCTCESINAPDPSNCVDDGDCSNGEEMWDSTSCTCESINIPDPSTCIDDGDCANGIESWNTLTCTCDVSTEVDGCTDPTANNYDPLATCDDGTCDYDCPDPGTCDDNDCSNGEEVWDASICDCVAINVPDPSTCVDDGDCSNGEENWDAATCTCESINVPDPSTCVDDGDCSNGEESWDATTCTCVNTNIPDPSTCVDDGDCSNGEESWDAATCTCVNINIPDPSSCVDDGDCSNGEENWDAATCTCESINIPDPSTCVDDGDCTNGEESWDAATCTCESINIPDPSTCTDDGDCTNGQEFWDTTTCTCESMAEISGCTNATALNYDSAATCDDGSCMWDCNVQMVNIGEPCDDENPETENDFIDTNCECVGQPIITTKIYFPNTMSRDDQGNNEFRILSSEDVLLIDFSIFDRWGNMVHSVSNVMASDPSVVWRGTHDSKPAQIGVYIYRVEYETEEGNKIKYGEITYLN